MLQGNFPLYNCRKQVRAVQITQVIKHAHPDPDFDDAVFEASADFKGVTLFYETENGPKTIAVNATWYHKHKPEVGGYYVVYKDGYTSYSPARAFDDGYTLDTAEAVLAEMPAWYVKVVSTAKMQMQSRLPYGFRTGLYDTEETEICIGDIVQQPVTSNTGMHGVWVRSLVWSQGIVPVLLYITSETGDQLPFGYLASQLADAYNSKLFLWAKDLTNMRPSDPLVIVEIK